VHDEHVETGAEQRAGSGRSADGQAPEEADRQGQGRALGSGRRRLTPDRAFTHSYFLYDSEIPSPAGDTIAVQRAGLRWMASRKSSISPFLFTTLCAVNSPPLSS